MSSFITNDATQEVFELVLARPVVTAGGEHPRLVHLWWRAPMQGDRLVQVYVDDALYDVTLDTAVRALTLTVDRSLPRRIELLAVAADDVQAVWRAQPGLLNSWQPAVRSVAALTVVRIEDLPADTQIVFGVDGEVVDRGPMWPTIATRSGYGEQGGASGGACPEAAGLGLGVGDLGAGRLGYGGTAIRWRREGLDVGVHALSVHATDPAGLDLVLPYTSSFAVQRLASPVKGLSMDTSFGLTWDAPS